VEHLGDWLIDQFPMSVPTDEKQLQIGDEILMELPLDRTIRHIQKHKTVFSHDCIRSYARSPRPRRSPTPSSRPGRNIDYVRQVSQHVH
jgi:hypothetical protein